MIIYVDFDNRHILTETEFQKEMEERKANKALSFDDYLRDNWELEEIARTDFDELWCAYQTYLGRFLEDYEEDDIVCVDVPDNCALIYVDWDSEDVYTEREYLATREAHFVKMLKDDEKLEDYLESNFSALELAQTPWEELKSDWRDYCAQWIEVKMNAIAYTLK